MKIRLTKWALQEGISYITALRWAKVGKIPGLHRSPSGRLFVDVGNFSNEKRVAIYGRVSSSGQKDDLDRQMGRLRDFVAAQGMVVGCEVSEIGSGLNGRRRKLIKLLKDHDIGIIVVEHRDRLTRFGFEYIEAVLQAHDRTLLVMNEGEEKLDIVQDFIDVITSMCARIYGRRSAKNKARLALKAMEEN